MTRARHELLDAREVAGYLRIPLRRLRSMAERGEYPELLHVTRGEYRVRQTDHDAWMQARWTSSEAARQELEWARLRGALLRGES